MRTSATAENKIDERDYLTVPEAAGLLRVSPSTVWRWVEAGRLPAYRVGPRAIRIRKVDLGTVLSPAHPVKRGAGAIESHDDDIWAGYDPEGVRKVIREGAGSWSDVDADALVLEIYRAREAGTRPPGRS